MNDAWRQLIQEMLDLIDVHIARFNDGSLTLAGLAKKLGYSRFYVTRRFHEATRMSFRQYLRSRRLAFAAIELRDSRFGVLNIAQRYGFASQEAFTRAFKHAYGVTPAAYRKRPIPLVLQTRFVTYDPYLHRKGTNPMSTVDTQTVRIYSQKTPAHLFLHIRNGGAYGYFDFWRLQEQVPGQDCHTICGILDSIPGKLDGDDAEIGTFSGQIMAYLRDDAGGRATAYGVRLAPDWAGVKPPQMLLMPVPEGEYMVFEHPPFDYQTQCEAVSRMVHDAADRFNFDRADYIDDAAHRPSYLFFEPQRYLKIMRPIRRK